MAIYGIFGGLGNGKTLTATHFLYFFFKQGKKILANIKLNFDYTYMDLDLLREKGVNDTQFFRNKVLLIDEIHLLMESRRSSASLNVDFSQNILIQLSKLDCTFIYTSQLLSQIDLRVKNMTKYFIFCSKVDSKGQPIETDLRIVDIPIFIDLDIVIVHSDTKIDRLTATLDPSELFSLYDTRELITFDRSQYLK